MALRKLPTEYSVRHVSKVEDSHSQQTPPISEKRKKNASCEKLSKKKKNFTKNITGEGLRLLK